MANTPFSGSIEHVKSEIMKIEDDNYNHTTMDKINDCPAVREGSSDFTRTRSRGAEGSKGRDK